MQFNRIYDAYEVDGSDVWAPAGATAAAAHASALSRQGIASLNVSKLPGSLEL